MLNKKKFKKQVVSFSEMSEIYSYEVVNVTTNNKIDLFKNFNDLIMPGQFIL